MGFLAPVWFVLQGLFFMGVVALGADTYINAGQGFGYEIPQWFYLFVGLGVIGIPAFWAVCHIIGGGLFGMAAGGIWDGMKLGFVLGGGMAVARLWPYAGAWGVGTFVGEGPIWIVVVSFMLAGFLYGLNKFVMYFWRNLHKES